MSRRLQTLALPFLLMVLGCSTTPTMPDLQSAVKAVPCVELPIIAYHAPTSQPDANNWIAGRLVDTDNSLDTPDTVLQVRKFNAARRAVCGP